VLYPPGTGRAVARATVSKVGELEGGRSNKLRTLCWPGQRARRKNGGAVKKKKHTCNGGH